MTAWRWSRLDGLSGPEVHDLLRLRQDVFVLEQRCLYPDIDGRDGSARHLLGRVDDGPLAACARVFAPGDYYAEPAIGRVAVAKAARGSGIAPALMQEAHPYCAAEFGTAAVRLNAQAYLEPFYASLGYHTVRGPYLEDDIPHIEMLKEA